MERIVKYGPTALALLIVAEVLVGIAGSFTLIYFAWHFVSKYW